MIGRGVGEVLVRFMGCVGWGYGRISRGVGGCFPVIDLRCDVTPRFRFWHDLWCGIKP